MVNNKNTKLYLLLSFVIPPIILFIALSFANIGPLGKESILVGDMYKIYAKFYTGYQDMFRTGNFVQIFYTWKIGLGQSFVGNFAYFLASPFSLIVLLFPSSMMSTALLVMTLVKVAFEGLAFSLYIKYVHKNINIFTVMFAVMYSLMCYVIVYFLNIMWLDGLIFMPLILIGVHKIIETKKIRLFIIFLTIMFISNFYLSYMIGIFTFIYFIAIYINRDDTSKKGFKNFLRYFFKFMLGAIIAALISCILLIPAYFSLKNGGGLESNPIINTFRFSTFAEKLFLGTYDEISFGAPNIYCGLIPLILVIPFFLNKKISYKEKLTYFIILAIFILSFSTPIINFAWHCFNSPVWYMFRYSFIFSFVVLIIAYKAFINIEYTTNKVIIISCAILLSMLIGIFFIYDDSLIILINIVFIIIYMFLLLLYKNKNHLSKPDIIIISALIFVAVLCETTIACRCYLVDVHREVGSYKSDTYSDLIKYRDDVSYLNNLNNNEFFRTTTNTTDLNTGMALNANGLSISTTFSNQGLNKFLTNDFGVQNDNSYTTLMHWNSNLLLDSVLNMKYVLSNDYLGSSYIKLNSPVGVINENPYALSLGFVVSDYTLNNSLTFTNNYLENDNILLNAFEGINLSNPNFINYMSPITNYSLELNNLAKYNDKMVTDINPNKSSNIIIKYTAPYSGEFYLNISNSDKLTSYVYANNKYLGDYGSFFCRSVLDLGYLKKGQEMTLAIDFNQDVDFNLDSIELYGLNLETFNKTISTLKKQEIQNLKVTNTTVSGNVTASNDNQALFLSIPYDTSWKAYINGKQVKTYNFNYLTEIRLQKGTQNILLKFVPQGIYLGIISCIIGLVLLFIIIIFEN